MTERRPMPVARARALLSGTQVFVKGEGELDGRHVLTSDLLWEALLSLEDAAELVAVASRLEWQFHPRGFDNVDLHRRYGDGIVPWLASRLDASGLLHNNPWCVVPCLLACGNAAAFELAWQVREIAGRTAWGGAGDGDLVLAWVGRHPVVGRAELERRAPTDQRARTYLRAMGHPGASPASAGSILALLDACALGLMPTRVLLWPPDDANDLRIVAARDADDWGVAIERIEGSRPSGFMAARVVTYAFGSRVGGRTPGAAIAARPVPALDATQLDDRLGSPALALPALALPPAARIVAVIPHAAHAARPSESPVFTRVVAALGAE